MSGLLRELIVALLEEPTDYDQRPRGKLLADLILDEISRGEQVALGIPMPTDKRLLRLCNDIHATPADDRSIDQPAATAGASTRTLTRLFRQQLGMSMSAWRQQVGFHYALEAIARGDPIGRVAHDCGYRRSSAFFCSISQVFWSGNEPDGRIGESPGNQLSRRRWRAAAARANAATVS